MDVTAYLRRDHITSLVNEGNRMDGRQFDQYREISIEKGYVSGKPAGSAYVSLGDTKVLVGISMDVGQPYPDTPDDGVMTTSVELRPIASPLFELGPPREGATEIARVVDRGIRESGAIDTKKLVINDEKVWVVFIDIHVLDDGGNLIDAAGMAAISALLDAQIPKYEDDTLIRGEWNGKLPVTCEPVPCTVAKVGSSLLLDPDLDEEYAMDCRLTVTTTDTINAMQKGGGRGSFTEKDVDSVVDLAFSKNKEIREQIKA